MTEILAVVLAGGRGKRMDILCDVRPKPVLPFAGGFRVIDFSLSNCIHSGITSIAVLTDYQRSQMSEYLNRWRKTNAGLISFDVLEPEKGCYKGTADAVYQNLERLRKSDAETVLVLAGDHIYQMDYREMLAFHQHMKADVTVGVVTVPTEQAYRFGTVRLDSDSRITDFVEKSPDSQNNLASMGIYVFDKRVLMERLSEDAARPDSPHDFGYAIMPEMVRRDRVFAYQFQGYWQDIGCKDVYYAANMNLLGNNPAFSLDSQWRILSEEQEPVLIQKMNQGSVENSLVGPGCIIKGRVQNSILSPGVCVEEKAVVLDSIIMADVNIGSYSVVHRCIVDENVSIGQYCYLGYGATLRSLEHHLTVIGKGATVPNNTTIGRNCIIMPDVSVADFNCSIVRSGETLSPHSTPRYTSPAEERWSPNV